MQVKKRSTYARPGMHMQQCSAVHGESVNIDHCAMYSHDRCARLITFTWPCFAGGGGGQPIDSTGPVGNGNGPVTNTTYHFLITCV